VRSPTADAQQLLVLLLVKAMSLHAALLLLCC
jgi:hypothetical protein